MRIRFLALLAILVLSLLTGCPLPPVYSVKREVPSAPSISCAREAVLSLNGVVQVVANKTESGYILQFQTAHGAQSLSVTRTPKTQTTTIQSIGTNPAGKYSNDVISARQAEAEAAVAAIQQKCEVSR
jgi:hypothetical protein